ncbi:MAG: exo-alpha-sialidase [Anaerolineae bacterium]|nr:exo-alpha-sialidase [Anaerolineae bacterium]
MRTITIATKGHRQWMGIPSITRAPNGRLWAAFYSGGPKEPDISNHILFTTSDDGRRWSEPTMIVDPPGSIRAYDPCVWHDPQGRMWLFYNRACLDTGEYTVWAMVTPDASAAAPVWAQHRRIDLGVAFAFRLNKPTVLSDGTWLLPVTWARRAPEGWFAGPGQLQGVAISTDDGETWSLHGAVEAPEWALENMIVAPQDAGAPLTMLIRTGSGVIWCSLSHDGGRTWSESVPTEIVNPGSRFFIRRLASGRLLLINTPRADARTTLFAYVSDSGDDWTVSQSLLLDPRSRVSYPDAVQAPDGTIYAVHDHDRGGAGEIVLAIFREEEIGAA